MDSPADDLHELALNEFADIDTVNVGQHGERFVHVGVELRPDVASFETHAAPVEYVDWRGPERPAMTARERMSGRPALWVDIRAELVPSDLPAGGLLDGQSALCRHDATSAPLLDSLVFHAASICNSLQSAGGLNGPFNYVHGVR